MQGFFIACCIMFMLTAAAASGCTRTETACGAVPPSAPSVRKPHLVIGLLPEQNVFRQLERYRPLAEYLSERTGTAVGFKVLLRRGTIVDHFSSEGIDGAFLSGCAYAIARARLDIRVIARPEGLDGRSTYHGVIFVRRDSGIRGIGDMRGKRLAVVDRSTTEGSLLSRAYFRRYGAGAQVPEEYAAGSHEKVILDVLDRHADVGAAKSSDFERIGAGRYSSDDLLVLQRTPETPDNALVLKRNVDPGLAEKVRGALLAMHRDPAGGAVLAALRARRFIATTEADYGPVMHYLRKAGIDPARYVSQGD